MLCSIVIEYFHCPFNTVYCFKCIGNHCCFFDLVQILLPCLLVVIVNKDDDIILLRLGYEYCCCCCSVVVVVVLFLLLLFLNLVNLGTFSSPSIRYVVCFVATLDCVQYYLCLLSAVPRDSTSWD